MKPIEYSPPRRKQPVFACCKAFMRIFMRKVRVAAEGGAPQERCVYLANHANKMGPMKYEMFFPAYHVKWGAHQMLEGYGARRAYLRDVLYIQKNGTGRRLAAFKAFFEAFFSKYFYRGMKFLPTYPDARFARTVRKSVDVLDGGAAIMIYPENSDNGYADKVHGFYSGFVLLLGEYYKKHGEDVPVRPVYYHAKKRVIAVGEPCFLQEYVRQGLNREQIAAVFERKVNALCDRIEQGAFDAAAPEAKAKKR